MLKSPASTNTGCGLLPLLGVLVFFIGAVQAAPASHDEAARFVEDLAHGATATLADQQLTGAERKRAIHQLLIANFDLDVIVRLVLGRHWQRASEPERREFRRLFEQFVVSVYARRFDSYAGEQIITGGARPAGQRYLAVASEVVPPDGRSSLAVDWVVAEKEGRFRVIDVHVEGVSMVVTQRSEFSALLERNGGRFAALLEALRAAIADGRPQPASPPIEER